MADRRDIPSEADLLAYVENTLEPTRRAEVERAIRRHPNLARAVAGMAADREGLRGLASAPGADRADPRPELLEAVFRRAEADRLIGPDRDRSASLAEDPAGPLGGPGSGGRTSQGAGRPAFTAGRIPTPALAAAAAVALLVTAGVVGSLWSIMNPGGGSTSAPPVAAAPEGSTPADGPESRLAELASGDDPAGPLLGPDAAAGPPAPDGSPIDGRLAELLAQLDGDPADAAEDLLAGTPEIEEPGPAEAVRLLRTGRLRVVVDGPPAPAVAAEPGSELPPERDWPAALTLEFPADADDAQLADRLQAFRAELESRTGRRVVFRAAAPAEAGPTPAPPLDPEALLWWESDDGAPAGATLRAELPVIVTAPPASEPAPEDGPASSPEPR